MRGRSATTLKHLNWQASPVHGLPLSQYGHWLWPPASIFMRWQSGICEVFTMPACGVAVVVPETRAATGVATRLNTRQNAKTERRIRKSVSLVPIIVGMPYCDVNAMFCNESSKWGFKRCHGRQL